MMKGGKSALHETLKRQILTLDIDDPADCLALFKSNNRVEAILFLGLTLAIPFAG